MPDVQDGKMSRLLALAEKALVEARRTLAGPEARSYPGLERVISKLEIISREMETGMLSKPDQRDLGIGHLVTDQWPFDSELSELAVSVEQLYRRL